MGLIPTPPAFEPIHIFQRAGIQPGMAEVVLIENGFRKRDIDPNRVLCNGALIILLRNVNCFSFKFCCGTPAGHRSRCHHCSCAPDRHILVPPSPISESLPSLPLARLPPQGRPWVLPVKSGST